MMLFGLMSSKGNKTDFAWQGSLIFIALWQDWRSNILLFLVVIFRNSGAWLHCRIFIF
jgi:hypothetical protein